MNGLSYFGQVFKSYSVWRGSETFLIPKLEIVIRMCKERLREKFFREII